jgi:alkanesulfonate monooxygenase SsuD/methylene tetrahydromethanopterin reductase-like flavin-dependent oxidoreductase (luciferase family)
LLARRFLTLDHLTGGRIGWNIVTAYLDCAAKDIGLPRRPEYDTRYDIAEEYMQIVYKPWEGSWEVGAGPRIGIGNTLFPIPNRPLKLRFSGPWTRLVRASGAGKGGRA